MSVIGQFKQDIFVDIDTNQAFSDSEYQAMDIPVYIQKESDVVIYGAIHSDINQISGTYVHLTIQRDDGKIYIKDVVTDSKGKYRDNSFISTLGMGNYELSASYSSDDSEIYTSNIKRFVIEKGIPTLSCLRSASVEPNLNTDFSITGLLTPASEIPIILRVTRPDNSFNDYTLCVDNEGEYTITSSFFEQQGIWLFKAYWPGDKQFSGCESNLLRVPVSIDFGRAIILAGGMANQQNILWEVTKKLSVNAYRAFRKMGFSNDMICFMINSEIIDIDYDDHADNVVDIDPPTTSIFLEKIEFEYQNDVNQDTPLFIYMIGKGNESKEFQVYGEDQYVSAGQMNTAIENLQLETNCTVVLILESCFSGNFIDVLKGDNRILLTSTGNQYYTIDSNGKTAFSNYLFEKLIEGDHLSSAFIYAQKEYGTLHKALPLMSDSTDLAESIVIAGEIHYGIQPVINDVALNRALAGNISETNLTVKVSENSNVTKVWAMIIPPDPDISETNPIIDFIETELTYDSMANNYYGKLTNFTSTGIYTIIITAQNTHLENSSPHIEYVSKTNNINSLDINMDGEIDIADVIWGLRVLCLNSIATLDHDRVDLAAVISIFQIVGQD